MEVRLLAAIAFGALLLAGIGAVLDMDGDGLTNAIELRDGTSLVRSDSDADGLSDGIERSRDLDPLRADADGDGVLDGLERAVQCVWVADCDRDGLSDANEPPRFDALDPDTFDVGLSDGVVAAFEAAGQPASPDADRDGIPDGWEETDGLIAWGDFAPRPGQRDLLIEFLRVSGPDSGRFQLDFSPAYQLVAQMFAVEGITLQWIETPVSLTTEHRPDFLTEDTIGYYDTVLARGKASNNPYVTTLVLNPQQTQPDLAGEILGAAFLRSMIATIDYGAHATLQFREGSASGISMSGTIDLQPVLESHIVGARAQQIRQLQFANQGIIDLGVQANGELYLVTRDSGNDFRWRWSPEWFATAPNITVVGNPSAYLQLELVGARLSTQELASTIAHELGHTLGLCHAHELECYQEFDRSDINQAAIDSTTMSYSAPLGQLHFLQSEWRQVHEYLTCPPQEPVALVAAGADAATFQYAKYSASFTQQAELRACGDAEPVAEDLPSFTPPVGNDGLVWLLVYLVGGVGALVLAARRF